MGTTIRTHLQHSVTFRGSITKMNSLLHTTYPFLIRVQKCAVGSKIFPSLALPEKITYFKFNLVSTPDFLYRVMDIMQNYY